MLCYSSHELSPEEKKLGSGGHVLLLSPVAQVFG